MRLLTGPIYFGDIYTRSRTCVPQLCPVFHTYLVGILQTFKNIMPCCLLILHLVRVGVMKLHRNEVAQ